MSRSKAAHINRVVSAGMTMRLPTDKCPGQQCCCSPNLVDIGSASRVHDRIAKLPKLACKSLAAPTDAHSMSGNYHSIRPTQDTTRLQAGCNMVRLVIRAAALNLPFLRICTFVKAQGVEQARLIEVIALIASGVCEAKAELE